MIYEATFEQIAAIYSTLAKANKKLDELQELEIAYNKASDDYINSGYVHSKGAIMSARYEMKEKGRKALSKIFKDICKLFQCSAEDYNEDEMLKRAKRIYTAAQARRFLYLAETEAARIFNYRKQYA